MRFVKVALLIASVVLIFASSAFAGQNSMGISDRYLISFSEQVRVADQLLPSGSYEIRHVMEGADHVMVFRQMGVKNPLEVRAKCTLVTLSAKAEQSQKIFEINSNKERVLKELTFKGDLAKHVF
jgi:hypothetical protein